MVITGDLFNLYVFLEISSLASYALVALGDRRAPVSAFRYLMLGTIGASFYLLGLAFLFFLTGSLNMADVARILPHLDISPPLLLGVVLMILGLGLKLALFPLHAWLPDAYTHASSAATALLAPIGTKVAAYALIRILFYVLDPAWMREESAVLSCIAYLGAAGIVWGSIMAIAQHDLKRMLAYSSVGQVGYIALGIGLASPLGLIGAMLHIVNHACMKACLFLVSANFLARLGHADIRRLDHGVRVGMPWTSAAFALAAMSMIGLPPTAGFFSKWYLALGAFEAGAWILIAVLLASTLLNAVYFFRILERIYLKPQGAGQPGAAETDAIRFAGREVEFSMLTPTLVLAAGVLVLGLTNALIVNEVIRKMIPAGL
jgi:multicomponent Na+:H+ antiporter subunit D